MVACRFGAGCLSMSGPRRISWFNLSGSGPWSLRKSKLWSNLHSKAKRYFMYCFLRKLTALLSSFIFRALATSFHDLFLLTWKNRIVTFTWNSGASDIDDANYWELLVWSYKSFKEISVRLISWGYNLTTKASQATMPCKDVTRKKEE